MKRFALVWLAAFALLAFVPAPALAVDLTVTPANVAKGTGAFLQQGYVAGETLTAGQSVYLKDVNGNGSLLQWFKAKNSGTAAEAVFGGIALNAASANQPVAVQTSGEITIGATVVVGTFYCVSSTYGGIAPVADLATTNKVSLIGYAKTTTILVISPILTGVSVP